MVEYELFVHKTRVRDVSGIGGWCPSGARGGPQPALGAGRAGPRARSDHPVTPIKLVEWEPVLT